MSVIKRLLLLSVVLIAVTLVYLSFWPVPIEPAPWTPPAAPALTGTYQQNNRLAGTERLSLGHGFAPEDVAIDSEQRIYAVSTMAASCVCKRWHAARACSLTRKDDRLA